jgi:hypothetical protein
MIPSFPNLYPSVEPDILCPTCGEICSWDDDGTPLCPDRAPGSDLCEGEDE